MSVPDPVRKQLKHYLWETADRIGWMNLSAPMKAKRYEDWTKDPAVGGLLGKFIDKGKVRVYIKDTLLKDYPRERMGSVSRPFRILGISAETEIQEAYIKPHGRRLKDGRVICWGNSDEWKSVLMAVYERAYLSQGSTPYAAVLLHPSGRFREERTRGMVEAAAWKLAIPRLVWLD